MMMSKILMSKILLFLIALLIPTAIFLTLIVMMSVLLKGNAELSVCCIAVVTFFLIISAEQMNGELSEVFVSSIIILIGAIVLSCIAIFPIFEKMFGREVIIDEQMVFFLVCGWSLSCVVWTCNLFKKQEELRIVENGDLIGGWYGVNGGESRWLPVLAFEKDYTATFYDGKIVKEYNYHICCNTGIVLIDKEGEKNYVERFWVKGKPHLIFNGQKFTQNGEE